MAEHFSELADDIAAELDTEFESNLITVVKSFRCLYAKDDPDYHNMQQNKIAWLKVSHSLRKTVTECMNRWYCLLKTFLLHNKIESQNSISSVWPHYESLKEMQSYISDNYSELAPSKQSLPELTPTHFQKELLFIELSDNRVELISLKTPTQRKQQIWAQIVDKLNQIPDGVQMPIVRWQKFWWDLKQNVGVQRSRIRVKLQAMGTKIDVAKYSEEDLKILKFCGTSAGENKWNISAALGNSLEFGSDKDKVVRKCKKCTIFLNDLLPDEYCETCRKIPKSLCDICSKPHVQPLVTHKVSNWSVQAKLLLPQSFYSYAELSICNTCSSELKKKAGMSWKACRVCECYKQNLESLFSSANDNLRKVFFDATNIRFGFDDGLPNYICNVCKVQMQQFNNFYLKFYRVQNRLRGVHRERFMGTPLVSNQNEGNPQNKQLTSINKVMLLSPGQEIPTNNSCMPPQPTANYGPVPNTQPVGTSRGPNGKKVIYMRKKVASREGVNPNGASSPVVGGISPGNGSRVVVASSTSNTSPGVVKRTFLIPKGTSIRTKTFGNPAFTNSRLATAASGPKIVSATSLANKLTKRPITTGPVAPPIPLKQNFPMQQGPMPPPNSGSMPTKATANTIPTISPSIRVTQPAVFRIPGEAFGHKDSPPVFCIPKASPHPRTSPSNMSQFLKAKLHNLSDDKTSNNSITDQNSPETTIIEKVIKTEKIDDNETLMVPMKTSGQSELSVAKPSNMERRVNSDASSSSSTLSVESHNSISREPIAKEMKLIRLDGTTVVLRSNPSGGGFMPFPPNEDTSFQNAFLSASAKLPSCKFSKDKAKLNTSLNLGQKPASQQNLITDIQDRHQQLSGTKKLRKYWGTVDEFQISLVSEKSPPNPESIQQPKSTANGLDSISKKIGPPMGEVAFGLILKTEKPDNDDDCLIVDDQPVRSDINPSMFYPDSFELENVAMDVDVSSMIEDMMKKPNAIANRDTESFKYIDPSFLKSYALNQELSKKDEIKEKKESIENKLTEKKPSEATPLARFPMKKLRVRLKRYRIPKLSGSMKNPTTELMVTRKSLRKSKGGWETKIENSV